MRGHTPDLTILTNRDCLVTFAAMVLCCDNRVRDHEMAAAPPTSPPKES